MQPKVLTYRVVFFGFAAALESIAFVSARFASGFTCVFALLPDFDAAPLEEEALLLRTCVAGRRKLYRLRYVKRLS